MISLYHFVTPPGPCGYLPERSWQYEHEYVVSITPEEYLARMEAGWRRFGHDLFRPRCAQCSACQSLRVITGEFRPNRSQRRCRQINEPAVRLEIGKPRVDRTRLDLYDRFHAFQSALKGWPEQGPKDRRGYIESFVANPFPVQEWTYYVGSRLIGVGYVDDLPGGMSAIYFFYDPDERDRSLGTWNVLSILAKAQERSVPFVYLGYFVNGCRSLEYKANFAPNQIRMPSGEWVAFRA
jgi:arginine-tRNA-protein transferase